MTYEQALEACDKVGDSKAQDHPLLAATLKCLSLVHAINPKLAYEGAVKKGLTARQVTRLGPVELGDLMFV
jgi:hypothetical protein